jgi:asparagine synthase (glutamine-hydrolysing)
MYERLTRQWQSSELLVVDVSKIEAQVAHPAPNGIDVARAMMLADAQRYLPDDILVKLDRASMAVGLEGRAPLLDHRLISFAFGLPLSMKLRGGVSKWLLRRVLGRYVPRELTDRPKSGFGIPLGDWLRGPMRPWAQDLLEPGRLQRQGYLRPEPIVSALREHLSGAHDRSHELWCVLMFQQWLEGQDQ